MDSIVPPSWPGRWRAYYYDGQRAVRHEYQVRLGDQGLEVEKDGRFLFFWRYSALRQTAGAHPGEMVRLEKLAGGHEAMVFPDLTFARALAEVAPRNGRYHHPVGPQGWRRTVLAALGVVAVASLLYVVASRALPPLLAALIPVAWEERLGETVVAQLAPEQLRCTDPALAASLDQIVARLAAGAPEAPYTFRVTVADIGMVNAFAAPGGYLVVFRGLLERTATPEELAGVLAHEMQHVLERHATKRLLSQLSGRALLSTLTGDSARTPLALQGAALLLDLHYSRADESEADRQGVALLTAARVDPQGMVRFFQFLERTAPGAASGHSYLATHPATPERIRALEALIRQNPVSAEPLLPGVTWTDLRSACRE